MAADASTPPVERRPRPSRLRRSLRWLHRLGLALLLLVAYGAVHLNQVGVPDVLKRPLLEQLRQRGLNLDFSRLRVRLGRGLIAEHVTVDHPGEKSGEHFYADEIQLKLDWSPLRDLQAPKIRALLLRNGLVQIPIPAEAGEAPYLFKVTEVTGLVVFVGPEEWELRSFEALCHGGRFRAFGSLTNASVLRHSRPRPTASSELWKRPLRRIGSALDHAQFAKSPVLSVSFRADLRALEQSNADVEFRADQLSYQGNDLSGLVVAAGLNHRAGTNSLLPAKLVVDAGRAVTRWGELTDFHLEAAGDFSATNALPDHIAWSIGAAIVQSRWAAASNLRVRGQTQSSPEDWTSAVDIDAQRSQSFTGDARGTIDRLDLHLQGRHSWTNWQSVSADLSLSGVTSRWATVDSAALQVSAKRTGGPETRPLPDFWRSLGGVELQAALAGSNLVVRLPKPAFELKAQRLATRVAWRGVDRGRLRIEDLDVALPTGAVHLRGGLEAESRRAEAEFDGSLDLQAYRPLLTPAAQAWIVQYGWPSNQPPVLSGSIGVTLPAWTNRQPDWRREVVPTLALQGRLRGNQFTFRGIPGDSAEGSFAYSNHVWRIPSLTATRPEGSIAIRYEGHDETKAFHFHLRSGLDPGILRPLLETDRAREAVSQFALPQAPWIEGDVWGVWKEPERTGADIRVAATNLVLRGEVVDSVSGHLQYTNRQLVFSDVQLRSQGAATFPGAALDLATLRLGFTNATTTLAPLRVARIIGPKAAKVMSNYLFATPPTTTINGVVGIGTNRAATDLRISAVAPRFHWWRLGLTNASADLRFVGETLLLTNLVTDLHGGSATATLFFDWSPLEPGSIVRGDVNVTNIQLAGLMRALSPASNRLDGLVVGHASFLGYSANTNSWSGSGQMLLRDGFLWDLPMFGIFSPLLDAVSPGAGQARFKDGQMTFTATNSVLTTHDLEVRSPTMRLAYRGTVDIASRLDARMEAELFRDAPVIGPLINFVLTPFTKLFVYEIHGTARKPIAEPRYVPKFLLAPLRPLKTIRALLPKEDAPEAPSTLPGAPKP